MVYQISGFSCLPLHSQVPRSSDSYYLMYSDRRGDMKRLIQCGMVISSLLIACGEPGSIDPSTADSCTDTLTLSVSDTLGIMFGDSIYVFGTIAQAGFDRDGNIIVLDGLKAQMSIFSPSGELLRTVGRKGSGPGEFQYPYSYALLNDGSLIIGDWAGAATVFFDSTFEFSDQLLGYSPVSPQFPVAGPGDSYIAWALKLGSNVEEYEGISFIGLYTEGLDPDLIYESWPLIIIEYMVDDELNRDVDAYQVFFDSDSQGILFAAVSDDSTYRIDGYNLDGTSFLVYEQEWERIEKTEKELEEDVYIESLSRRGDDGSSSVNRTEIQDIYPWHNAIGALEIDDENYIWIGLAYTSTPTFNIYDSSGELFKVVTIPELEGVRGLRYSFRNGMLAYDYAPLDYPKVYLLELSGLD